MHPTLTDVAREAGVSPATVDRVLHERPGVSARMRARVLGVAHQIGYLAHEAPRGPRALRLVALLPEGTNAFIGDLAQCLSQEAARLDGVALKIERTDSLDGAALAERLLGLQGRAEGVAVVAVDHPAVREALRKLDEAGIAVVTLATDISGAPHRGYVGIDNGQAGRLAGLLVGRFLPPGARGKVALFAGTLAYRGHQEREMGFRQLLAEDFPALDILELRESREDRGWAKDETRSLLVQHPDLLAIYNAGGASVGIAQALNASSRARDVVFVAHDATAEKTALVLNGTLDAVIDQDAKAMAQEALARLSAHLRAQERAPTALRLQLIMRENLPAP